MKDGKWTEEQVANEMLRLLRRISELEAAEIERKRAEETPAESVATC